MITERRMKINQIVTSTVAILSAMICSYQSGYQYNNALNGTLVVHAAGEGIVLAFFLVVGGMCGLLANITKKKLFSFLSVALFALCFPLVITFGYDSFPGLFGWTLISAGLAAETVCFYVQFFIVQKSK
jgi:hypothetical protein